MQDGFLLKINVQMKVLLMLIHYYRLCQDIPIDVVYTWVNGSDPVFLNNLKAAVNELSDKSLASKEFISRFEDNEVNN